MDADLGQGERNKFEYLSARVNEVFKSQPNFLSGYDPYVRNAISHSGAWGVTYVVNKVVFKNIKRGTPAIAETVTWSFEELQYRVIQLLECIQSIEIATEIFGLDCNDAISGDFDTFCQFVLHAVSPELRAELRERHSRLVNKPRASENVPLETNRDVLSQVLFYNCGLRDIPCRGVRLSEAAIMVEVPAAAIDLSDDKTIVYRAAELSRYAILARSIFGAMYDPFHLVETDEARIRQQLAVQISGEELDEYIEERAGLVDLLNDSKWTLEGQPIGIQFDFNTLNRVEMENAKEPFPRKHRDSR